MPPKAAAAAAVVDDEPQEEEAPQVQELDAKTLRSFTAYVKTLGEDANIVRFVDRKGFYTVVGFTATSLARQFYRTTAVLRGAESAGGPDAVHLNINRNMFETILRELLLGGTSHVVEVYEQVGTGWKLVRSATPGRLGSFDDELYRTAEMSEVPLVAALTFASVEGQPVAGVAYVDPSSCRLGAAELLLDESLGGLEAVLVQLGAREAVVNKDALASLDPSLRSRLSALLDAVGLMVTERPASPLFAAKHLEADLAKVIKGGAVERHSDVLERRTACSALAAVMGYAEIMADAGAGAGGGKGGGRQGGAGWAPAVRYSLSLYNAGCYMRLDATAQRALNVLPTKQDANATFSLFGLLNRCRTAMGKRRLKAWLKQPLVDLGAIRQRHDAVEALAGDGELRQRLRDQQLRGLADLERLTRKLQARKITLAELHQLYRASSRLPLVEEALRAHEGPHAAALVERFADPLSEHHDAEHLQRFEELIEAALDLDRLPEEYLIAPSYSEELAEVAKEKAELAGAIEDVALTVAKDLSLELGKSIKLDWHRAANTASRCLRITQKEEKNVRGKLQAKYQVMETRKDGTKFTCKALREAAEKLNAASAQYLAVQSQLVAQVVSVAATFVEVWEGVAALLAELDVLAAFAEAAVVAPVPYVRPEMLGPDEGVIELRGCRHPNVEVQDGVAFIANDCLMARGESWFQIITGPNMGGKSTYIRQVGVAVLMAQVGCFVPCESARISVRDSIFCRVGAGDSQMRGVSTFMAEMLETASILRGATSHSLVIIDELGRGTSTYDGFGLAWAISEHLAGPAAGAPTLFATHFHELTELRAAAGVKNMQAVAVIDPSTHRLTMLYEIREGACDQSFGVHVAESAGFPPKVIEMATQRLKELEAAQARVRGPATKRQRTDGAADVEALQSFLRRFASLPLDQLPPGEAVAAVDKLMGGVPPGLLQAA
ncbi:hypothetical protein HYH03_017259 [Edaphochlamys debaryana]|uniref:DNA mismatch repair proteins mutS family domain-containing protein n=1 Tax=Edaphochlamys debaryana TaxID=47281 RepID=A0A836BQN0_9CHLO|nr:hypothetical protein HYH03_017259 [Edaphochlamys debaryana]|eukprot:KAG2483939.1 hypothetical protein HYH03_017259 [Edaphochlamys debaryana]